MYDIKALYEATSVAHACQLRIEHPEAQIIAGGTDVLVQVREGRRAGKELISIQKLDELRGVTMEDDGTIAKHQVLRISLTFDHRLLDGAVAAKFEMTVRDLLEHPMDILL